jgi:hypothetical protein
MWMNLKEFVITCDVMDRHRYVVMNQYYYF